MECQRLNFQTMELESLAERFKQACLDVFREEQVEGVILHGSGSKGGIVPGYSDLDFMVFLTPSAFDHEGELRDEDVFALQARIGPLPWQEAGVYYPQAYFYDSRRLPEWWTGPVPGAYRELWGALPAQAMPTAEGLRASSRRLLKVDLGPRITWSLRNFIDSDDAKLPRRVRLLGTDLTPVVFALSGYDADDALELWALSKFEALVRLEERYPHAEGPSQAHRFFENVSRLYAGPFDPELGRETFRVGIKFLRWAERIGRSL